MQIDPTISLEMSTFTETSSINNPLRNNTHDTENPEQDKLDASDKSNNNHNNNDVYSNDVNRESIPFFAVNTVDTTPDTSDEIHGFDKKYTSINQALVIGFSGLVITVMGTTLDTLTAHCGHSSVSSGALFLFRWIGNIIGASSTTFMFRRFTGNNVLGTMLIVGVVFLLLLGYNTNYYLLHFYFFTLGVMLSVTDTGVLVLTRRLHKKFPGPWIGVNTLCFSIFGVIGPLLDILFQRVSHLYIFLSVFSIVLAIWMFTAKTPPDHVQSAAAKAATKTVALSKPTVATGSSASSGTSDKEKEDVRRTSISERISRISNALSITPINTAEAPHYYVEMMIGSMLLFYTGGSFAATFYLVSYVDDTGVISTSEAGSTLVFCMWAAMTVGRILSILVQVKLTHFALMIGLMSSTLMAMIGLSLILSDATSGKMLYVGIVLYGFSMGPCVTFTFDLNNRLTYLSSQGMSWVMFGMNSGTNLLPLLVSLWWSAENEPRALFICILIGLSLTFPIMWMANMNSYRLDTKEFLTGFKNWLFVQSSSLQKQ